MLVSRLPTMSVWLTNGVLTRQAPARVDLGWRAAPLEREDRPTLEAHRDGHRLIAHVVEGGVDLVLTSRPVADSAWSEEARP